MKKKRIFNILDTEERTVFCWEEYTIEEVLTATTRINVWIGETQNLVDFVGLYQIYSTILTPSETGEMARATTKKISIGGLD